MRPILYVESHVFTIQLIESTNYMMMYVIHFFLNEFPLEYPTC